MPGTMNAKPTNPRPITQPQYSSGAVSGVTYDPPLVVRIRPVMPAAIDPAMNKPPHTNRGNHFRWPRWRDWLSEITSSFSAPASIAAHWRTGLPLLSPYETPFRRPRTRAMTTATGIKRRVARQKLLRWMFPERRSAHTKHRMRLRSGTHSTSNVSHHSPTVSALFSVDGAASGRVEARKSKRP